MVGGWELTVEIADKTMVSKLVAVPSRNETTNRFAAGSPPALFYASCSLDGEQERVEREPARAENYERDYKIEDSP